MKLLKLFLLFLLVQVGSAIDANIGYSNSVGDTTSLSTSYSPDVSSTMASMQVELDVFSGIPNPRWDLNPREAEKFFTMLQALPRSQREFISGGLGYRGFIVRGAQDFAESFEEILIYKGVVLVRGFEGLRMFDDRNRALERWLLSTGQGKLDETFIEVISSEMNQS